MSSNDHDDRLKKTAAKQGGSQRSCSIDEHDAISVARDPYVAEQSSTSDLENDNLKPIAYSTLSKDLPLTTNDVESQYDKVVGSRGGGNIPSNAQRVPANYTQAPIAVRILTKAASVGCVVDNNSNNNNNNKEGKKMGRRHSMPGVEHVHYRAPGISPSFYLNLIRRQRAQWIAENTSRSLSSSQQEQQQQQQEHQQQPEPSMEAAATHPIESPIQESTSSSSSSESMQECAPSATPLKSPHDRCKVLATATILCLMIAVSIILGISIGYEGKERNGPVVSGKDMENNRTSLFGPFTKDCDNLWSEEQPNILSQCQCNGEISIVADDIAARYHQLSETFLPTLFPDFGASLESCHPRNQAMVWLASGDGGVDSSSSSSLSSLLRQRYSLALLYILWNGPNWKESDGWLSSADECTWFGITCRREDHVVVDISLTSNRLVGTLSGDVSLLSQLTSLALDRNDFQQSTIPSEISTLTNLQNLILSSTNLHGTIPTQLFQPLGPVLQYFYLDQNDLSGTVPTLVGELSQLARWVVGSNNLTGTIPTEFGRCTHLTEFQVGANALHGTLPTQVGSMTTLETFSVQHNELTGTIPNELGHCTNLQNVLLGNNHFLGTMPHSLASLTVLINLDVEGNQLSGTTPDTVCQRTTGGSYCIGCNCANPQI